MKAEIWKKLPIGSGIYEVSNYGNVKTHYRSEEGRLLNIYTDRLGYQKIRLCIEGNKSKEYSVHRLVALMFVPNPFLYNEVNHLDGNKKNNYYENLEWCTRSQNMKHAFAIGLDYTPSGSEHHSAKAFTQFDMKGNFIKHWGCIAECARILLETDEKFQKEFSNARSLSANIGHVLNGKHKSCCGYLFSYNTVATIPNYDTRNKPIIATDKKNGEQLEFSKIQGVEGYIMPNGQKANASNIVKCCKGKRPSHAGYYWNYKK